MFLLQQLRGALVHAIASDVLCKQCQILLQLVYIDTETAVYGRTIATFITWWLLKFTNTGLTLADALREFNPIIGNDKLPW